MSKQLVYDELLEKVVYLESQVLDYKTQLEHLKSSESIYRSTFKHLLYEVHVWELIRNPNGSIKTWKLVDANPASLISWKTDLASVVGKTTDEIFKINATELFMPVVEKIFNDKSPHTWEQHFPATSQTLYMVSIPIGERFISSGVDITTIKDTEKELQDTVLRLSESITASKVGLWEWDLTTDITTFSTEWKKQIGYEDHEITNDFEEWRSRVHPDDLKNTMEIVQNSVANCADDHEVEFRFMHRDGKYRHILAHASVIKDEHNTPIKMLGSHIDISRNRNMEEELNQSRKMKALGTIASGIAHDFNNLLTPILSYAQLAQSKTDIENQVHDYLNNIVASANRAKELVEKILVINRTDVKDKQNVSLETLIAEVDIVLQSSCPKNVYILHDIDENIPLVVANPSEIYQVILNLCTNAIQAMPDGGILNIRLARPRIIPDSITDDISTDSLICLAVADNGRGMDSNTLAQIYDPFFTTKNKGEKRGTGLGLAIVASVIKQHQGYLSVFSEPDKGTTFEVYLPISTNQPIPDVINDVPETIGPPTDAHIMLIDDEEMLCTLGVHVLEELGYQVTPYTDPLQAIDEFELHPNEYQLVITDYSMPEINGPQLIEKIKMIRKDIPAMIVTGYSHMATDENLVLWQCDRIASKPYDILQFNNMISELLSKST